TVSELRLPIGETVQMKMHSKDVIHSFWVPEFGQKQDLVPGIETKLVITPKRLGTYPIACTELCGEGHALMRSEAIVMKPAAFTAWVKAQEKAAASAAQGPASGGAGLAAFNSNGCSACHTYKPAGSTATTGPALDNLAADARRAGQPLVPFVRQSIVDPNAYIAKGYQPNLMPDTLRSLPNQQLDGLVRFLARIGSFDYSARYLIGSPTRPEDHSGHGAHSWRDYFRVNTDHKVIGVQYLVTTIFFFIAAGLTAMIMRAELARPGMQYVGNQVFNDLFSVHAALTIFLFIIPAFAGLGTYVIPLIIV